MIIKQRPPYAWVDQFTWKEEYGTLPYKVDTFKLAMDPFAIFVNEAQGKAYDYIIYIANGEGENIGAIACYEDQLVECFQVISAKQMYSRIQPTHLTQTYGWDDSEFVQVNLKNGYSDFRQWENDLDVQTSFTLRK